MRQHFRPPFLLGILVLLALLGAGCRCSRTPAPAAVEEEVPTLRLYLVSNLAGALEPCGCVKDMLGGVDHFSAFLKSDAAAAPSSLLLGAGPMLFKEPVLAEKGSEQDRWKAETLVELLGGLKFGAWSPGANDWAGGAAPMAAAAAAGMTPVAANLTGQNIVRTRVFEVGQERVGVAGVSVPAFAREPPAGLSVGDAGEALAAARAELEAAGARIRVALVTLPRGQALRLAETVPGFQIMVLGKPVERGETNDTAAAPVKIGDTLVVEGSNHLQAVAVVDLFVKGGSVVFADASGIEDEEKKQRLARRIQDLEGVLARKDIRAEDRAGRTADLESARSELAGLSKPRPAPPGSSFRYRLVEVREKFGTEPGAESRLGAYYRRVNEHNRVAFRDVLPPPVPEGQSDYVGIDQCTNCHQPERAFWDRTAHHDAYATLARQNKQFNLDCVSCHVTGYQAPGGSTVVHVEGLENVQCEVCHGPGSRHIANPADKALIKIPERTQCAAECHHPPHVKPSWSVDEAWKKIVGPGHQRR
ncbi:MAG TPA: multiheme c-type cytochrome [Polyangiaceae bacterium]